MTPEELHVPGPATHVLLLDVDGVLITPPEWFGARLRRAHPTETERFFGTAFFSASTGKSDLLTHLPAFLAEIGSARSPEEFLNEWLESENHPDKSLLESVRALRFKGWQVFLATNQEAHRTEHLLNRSGLAEVVDGHFASFAVGYRKPSPEYYAEVTRRLQVQPEQVVFWDDSAVNVTAASDEGWRAFLYRDVADFRQIMGLAGHHQVV